MTHENIVSGCVSNNESFARTSRQWSTHFIFLLYFNKKNCGAIIIDLDLFIFKNKIEDAIVIRIYMILVSRLTCLRHAVLTCEGHNIE